MLAAAVIAQGRAPTFATVVDLDGQPLVGAEVTCVSSADLAGLWPTDIVTNTTKERGRARCDLVVGRLYSAWAIGPAGEKGERALTEVTPLLAAGRVIELRVSDRRPPRTVTVDGHAAWRQVGATGMRWYPDAGEDSFVDLPWADGDRLALPPSPLADGALVLIDARGEPLAATRVADRASETPAFAAPAEVTATITAADKPLVGARICQRLQLPRSPGRPSPAEWQIHRQVGETDADGVLRFHVPIASGGWVPVFASKPGLPAKLHEITSLGAFAIQLTAQEPAVVRVRGDGHDVVRFAAVVAASSATAALSWPLPVEPTTPGRWRVEGGDRKLESRLHLPAKVPTAFVTTATGKEGDELTVDLDKLRTIEISVVDAAGGPVACAVVIRDVEQDGVAPPSSTIATDQAGRAIARLPGWEFAVYATTGTAHALALVAREGTDPVRLRLEPLPMMQVRVRDAAGMPVAGARLECRRSQWRPPSSDALGRQWARLGPALSWTYVRGRSNREGLLRVPVPLGHAATAVVTHGAATSDEFQIEPGGEVDVTVKE